MELSKIGKDAAKRLLRAAVSWLPPGASAAVLDQASENLGPWAALVRIAPRCAVDTLSVQGSYGVIEGSPRDSTVLGGYSSSGVWAKRTNQILCDFFSGREGRYVDVGANIGLTTIPVAQNPRVACMAIEPNPVVYRYLARNVSHNCRHGNVVTRQAAAFARRDTLLLEVAPDNLGDNRLRLTEQAGEHGEECWSTVRVEALPLDDLIPEGDAPMAIKIDTQGAEPFVFEGGTRTLDRAQLLICEWSPYLLARLGGQVDRVTTYLARSFEQLTIAHGEDGELARAEPVHLAVERLLAMANDSRDDSSVYADIIARR
jgi:FkbM family methyltransferase